MRGTSGVKSCLLIPVSPEGNRITNSIRDPINVRGSHPDPVLPRLLPRFNRLLPRFSQRALRPVPLHRSRPSLRRRFKTTRIISRLTEGHALSRSEMEKADGSLSIACAIMGQGSGNDNKVSKTSRRIINVKTHSAKRIEHG